MPLPTIYRTTHHYSLECDKAPKHFLVPTVINSSPFSSQDFMVSRIFSVVFIFLDPLMDKFTL